MKPAMSPLVQVTAPPSASTSVSSVPRQAPGRQRVYRHAMNRVRRDGKFFRLGDEKFYVKGVTYGPFERGSENEPLPERDRILKDFEQILDLGANVIRVYHTPPNWFMDMALEAGLKIFIDVAWPKNLTFVGDRDVTRQAHAAVREAARTCGNHPAIFAISVVNEVPPDILRFTGRLKVEQFIDDLVATCQVRSARLPHHVRQLPDDGIPPAARRRFRLLQCLPAQ